MSVAIQPTWLIVCRRSQNLALDEKKLCEVRLEQFVRIPAEHSTQWLKDRNSVTQNFLMRCSIPTNCVSNKVAKFFKFWMVECSGKERNRPCSQFLPLNIPWQKHWKPSTVFWQVPLFLHGLSKQWSFSAKWQEFFFLPIEQTNRSNK